MLGRGRALTSHAEEGRLKGGLLVFWMQLCPREVNEVVHSAGVDVLDDQGGGGSLLLAASTHACLICRVVDLEGICATATPSQYTRSRIGGPSAPASKNRSSNETRWHHPSGAVKVSIKC